MNARWPVQPGFGLGAGVLTEGGESNLGEAVFDNFVALHELVLFPEPEFAGGLLEASADFCNLFVGQGVIIDLLPVGAIKAVILSALGDKEMEMLQLVVCDAVVL